MHSIVVGQINKKKGQIFFPFIFVLFVFILINNLIGMVPYSFAPTSHVILTFSLSLTVVFGATIMGISKHGLVFFSLFVPAGCPLALLRAPCEAFLFIENLSVLLYIIGPSIISDIYHGYSRRTGLITLYDWIAEYNRWL